MGVELSARPPGAGARPLPLSPSLLVITLRGMQSLERGTPLERGIVPRSSDPKRLRACLGSAPWIARLAGNVARRWRSRPPMPARNRDGAQSAGRAELAVDEVASCALSSPARAAFACVCGQPAVVDRCRRSASRRRPRARWTRPVDRLALVLGDLGERLASSSASRSSVSVRPRYDAAVARSPTWP